MVASVVWRAFVNEVRCLLDWMRLKPTLVFNTPCGAVRGYKRREAVSLLGVPYGDSIAGEWRWKAPRPAPHWEGIRDCKDFPDCAPQDLAGLASRTYSLLFMMGIVLTRFVRRKAGLGSRGYKGDEDTCLALNVWAPYDHAKAYSSSASGQPHPNPLPVMVFIHGGAFFIGSGGPPLCRGEEFANHGCILVTLNYRLGVLGFLDVPGGDGNRGLRDQIQALRWVRENIGAIGGDPSNVTIFGESAGGMSVANLMASPLRYVDTQGGKVSLFRRAICMSGAAHNVHSKAKSEMVFREVMRYLPDGDATQLQDLDTLPYVVLHRAQQKFIKAHRGEYDAHEANDIIGLGPYIDGEVLTEHPLASVTGGFTSDLELVAGTVRNEYTLFTTFTRKAHDLDEGLQKQFEVWLRGFDPSLHEQVHEMYVTSDYGKEFAGHEKHRCYNAAATDWVFRLPCERLASAHSEAGGVAHVYVYEAHAFFNDTLGACHGTELAPMFGTQRGIPILAGAAAATDRAGRTLRETFVGFARDGLCKEEWPVFHHSTRRVMSIAGGDGTAMEVLDDPHAEITAVWGDLSQYDSVHP